MTEVPMTDTSSDPSPRLASHPLAQLAAVIARGDDLTQLFKASNPGTLGERMGIEFEFVSAERVVATMPVAGNTQPFGLLHGGASCVLAETLGSVGAAVHGAPLGKIAVGIEINATHHRGATKGLVRAVATALSLGSTMASYEIVLDDEAGRRICTARLSCLLRPAPSA